jgi:hypothetical protein
MDHLVRWRDLLNPAVDVIVAFVKVVAVETWSVLALSSQLVHGMSLMTVAGCLATAAAVP